MLSNHTFFIRLESEQLHFVLTADDKETAVLHQHTRGPTTPLDKAAHSASHVSLLDFSRGSCHFIAQHRHCVSRKCACAHLCTFGRISLKMMCGQTCCWRIAVFGHQTAVAPLSNKNLV